MSSSSLHRAVIVGLVTGALVAAGNACITTDTEPLSVDTTDGGVPKAIADATSEKKPKDLDAACPTTAPDATAPSIQDELVLDARPAAIGGQVVPGTYFLTRSETYIGDGGTAPDASPLEAGALSTTIARVVVITTDLLAYSEGEGEVDGGIDERDQHVQAYVPVGTALVLTELCPERDPFQLEYSAIGSELHLFPSATQREVLTRQP